jgi:AraC-like DNA-binding protein
MKLKTKLDSKGRCEYLKSLASQASYEPGRLAEMAEISLRQLERYSAKDFTATPKAWLRKQRMESACKLLSEAHSVKDAAYVLGFRQPSHFCREFKRYSGMTPSQFVLRRGIALSLVGMSCLASIWRILIIDLSW